MTKYLLVLLAAIPFLMPSKAEATVYYVDFSCNTPGNGTTATCNGDADDSYQNLDAFMEVARAAGDIAFVRRGMASTTNVSAIAPTSDGTYANPIVVSADFDNLWGDFSTSTQTFTVAIASSTFVASASTTGIVAGDWIYVAGDCSETSAPSVINTCNQSYEVRSVVDTVITLYRPYVGEQSGTGLYLRVMPDIPIWSNVNGGVGWTFDDDYWLIKGLHIRGSVAATTCNVNFSSTPTSPIEFQDSIFQGDDSTVCGFGSANSVGYGLYITRSRFRDFSNGIFGGGTFVNGYVYVDYSVFQNASNVAPGSKNLYIYNSIFETDDFLGGQGSSAGTVGNSWGRNITLSGGSNITYTAQSGTSWGITSHNLEDADGIGNNFYYNQLSSANNIDVLRSTTTSRTGGGNSSIVVTPSSFVSLKWELGKLKLFDYPIYTDTTSRQYDVYFKTATSTTAWTTNPTASELWIECEYWAHQTGATTTRKVLKSTGTVDFAGSSAWQALSVTCQPTQSGILYLRGWYGKTKESSKTNQFLVDVAPVFSTP